ncbi:hypothetical protein Hdeb2414_s0015g00449551 [Helianthus debilis subsp. tardiflorus]
MTRSESLLPTTNLYNSRSRLTSTQKVIKKSKPIMKKKKTYKINLLLNKLAYVNVKRFVVKRYRKLKGTEN